MPNRLFRICLALVLSATLALPPVTTAAAPARIKDIVDMEGIRENQLVGYGLVVGLNGTGDSLNNSPFTKQSLQSMLERLGVNTQGENVRTANVAAVMVTANLPPFATQGSRMDVSVAALGDADSLQGGTLLVTPLLGADGEVYAIAQGPVLINGFKAQGDAATVISGVPTTGRISSGALIEREIEFSLGAQHSLRLSLRNPDLTTARRIALAVNDFIGVPTAVPENPNTVRLTLPHNFNGNIVDLLTDIEQLIVQTDQSAKIVIDENSGIIVMGKDVRVSSVAVAQSNLTVTIAENPQTVQPNPLSLGQTNVDPNTNLDVLQTDTALQVVPETVTLQQLVDGLNALGISPRDLIAILQAIKATGALQAEIEVL
ncbi:flagellar basal body P-ring protein FlgI [Devosia sp. 63-57]|uniref:flagellar basal body P-ring protein FlgI n=1 Tax=Devosia sp. 63-57 TaxID=1895751 RepID=UPI00086B7194|nr:flagellar basal body P-ring protein FlgI [Devosia sp. 63-57]ODT49985.1 MAG: flagellar biosynthesis protein FlgA [Pelagibacterium sp. SCN 63-126]ODU81314.1 MAG: flagellar biosynthesis protein FlgA [Pelagibacterium sp. SCN 63-17]OJX45332.1 MAG: flagellar biosynthesis protein FlgA [Devosia sp. 63-57]